MTDVGKLSSKILPSIDDTNHVFGSQLFILYKHHILSFKNSFSTGDAKISYYYCRNLKAAL